MSRLRKIASLVLGVGLLAGCGAQGGGSTQKPSAAQRYLAKVQTRQQTGMDEPRRSRRLRDLRSSYRVTLTTARSAPIQASTHALVTLGGKRACWKFGNLPAGLLSRSVRYHRATVAVPQAIIRSGTAGSEGPALVTFGASLAPQGCTVVAPVVVNSIAAAPSRYHVEVVIPRYPHQPLRAQL